MGLNIGLINKALISSISPNFVVGGSTWYENFERETLQPASFPLLYTTTLGGTGGGTASLPQALNRLVMTTDSTASGDDVDVRASEFIPVRNITGLPTIWDSKSVIEWNIIFGMTSTTNSEVYIGIVDPLALAALPTTVRHLGIFLDDSAANNWFLTSGNGAAQATTDTTVSGLNTTARRLRIRATGLNDAVISFFDAVGDATPSIEQTVVLWGGDLRKQQMHFFIQTEEAVAVCVNVIVALNLVNPVIGSCKASN